MGNTAFAITADAGELGRQAAALARSIRAHHPDATTLAFVPEAGFEALSESVRTSLAEHATVATGPMPDPDYPISAQLRAFELAAERTSADRLVMLDTDILLLEALSLSVAPAPIHARPATLCGSFWTKARANDVWELLYDTFEVVPPAGPFRSVLGGRMPFPFYNAAVVVTHDPTIPARLRERTAAVREVARERVRRDAGHDGPLFYADQVALTLLAVEQGHGRLGLDRNYPVPAFPTVPGSVQALHYGSPAFLGTVRDDDRWRAVAADLPPGGIEPFLRRAASVGWFRLADRLPYRWQTRIRRLAGSRHAP